MLCLDVHFKPTYRRGWGSIVEERNVKVNAELKG